MLDFKKISLPDKEWMDPLFQMSDFQSLEYNFTFCYIWRNIFNLSAARMNDYLIIRADRKNYPPSYLYPAGSGDITPVIEVLKQTAEKEGALLFFHTLLEESKAQLEVLYPGKFEFMPIDDYADYIYDAQSLITLAGKKLHAKRNHIHRFKENYPDWSYEEITPENLPEVILMNAEWCRINGCDSDKTLRDEACSVKAAITDFFLLKLQGGLIRAGGKVVAFTMGDRLNSDTFLIHIEKAYGEIQGAYAVINQEFAKRNCDNYTYIDREDDSGNEGLRKAKQSYRPLYQNKKYAAKMIV